MNPIIKFRPYQADAFCNRNLGIEIWLWGRQTGKSFTLAAWAVDRLLTRPGRLVTILSNSRVNGIELNAKCAEVCHSVKRAFQQADLSTDQTFDTMNLETRITIDGLVGRIKVLAANPRTARGFSGDLILDEFAFHEDGQGIWEAAEPILSANPDYLCRVASTPNGKHNMFYHLVHHSGLPLRKTSRTDAWREGCLISHPVTREPITPAEARAMALDKKAYDQNYECIFTDANLCLLSGELIDRAFDPSAGFICDDNWSEDALNLIRKSAAPLFIGIDVGRHHDLTVITVLERANPKTIRGILRLRNVPLPDQQERIATICQMQNFHCAKIDATGLGIGLTEYLQQKFPGKISGVNFAASTTLDPRLSLNASDKVTVRIPEALALGLLRAYEDNTLLHPMDQLLREDLRKPERSTTSSGRVTIAATRDASGHADHFWSLALAVEAATYWRPPRAHQAIPRPGRTLSWNSSGRRDRVTWR